MGLIVLNQGLKPHQGAVAGCHEGQENIMKVGVFTPLLSALSLDDVLKKLKSLGLDTVEFGTGNYPGDAHAKLSMLDNPAELATFKSKIADAGMTISALSCHGNALHPDKEISV